MKTLLLFLFLGLAVAAPTNDEKIVSGYECSKDAAPWMVSLNVGFHMCSGALIQPRCVVSAANCYRWNTKVRLGVRNTTATEGSDQLIDAEMMIRHPKFNYYTLDNDIMLIKLSRPVAMNRNVVAVPLPTQCAETGDMCLIPGWSNTMDPAVRYVELQCLDSPVRSTVDCRGSFLRPIPDNVMCLGYLEGGRHRCKGNPGGPVVCNGVLQGVGSWGYACKVRDYPGLYTRVCNYISWIDNTIAAN